MSSTVASGDWIADDRLWSCSSEGLPIDNTTGEITDPWGDNSQKDVIESGTSLSPDEFANLSIDECSALCAVDSTTASSVSGKRANQTSTRVTAGDGRVTESEDSQSVFETDYSYLNRLGK